MDEAARRARERELARERERERQRERGRDGGPERDVGRDGGREGRWGRPPSEVTQVHEPGHLPVEFGRPARHACWDMLPPDTRATLSAKAGRPLAWWAWQDHGGHPAALLIGEQGLCHVNAQLRNGVPEFRGERIRLEPGSLRERTFGGRSAVAPGGALAPGRATATVRQLDLPAGARDVLGHFPFEVQDHLQQPFLAAAGPVTAEWYYEESSGGAHTSHLFILCMRTDRNLTLVEGNRTLPPGAGPDRAQWTAIRCHQARLVPR
ncbi:hypothetical protein [Streptomyces sp. NPDC012888]|uniref:hypothetical protein n=1 Tax=Streptomyces sp. NPDC012888 TaxID=3364855 RepID=UPI003692130C